MRLSTLLLTVVIVAAGLGVFFVMRGSAVEAPAAEKREPVVAVAVAEAAVKSHQPRISVIGLVEAKDEASLTSPLDTEVLEVNAEEGDQVARGDRLVVLDTRETNLQLEAQLAGIDDIKAQLEALERDLDTEIRRLVELRKLEGLANEDLNRNRALLERGVVAQAAVDRAQTTASTRGLEVLGQRQKIDGLMTSRKRLEASLRGANAQVGQLRLVLERAEIAAPFDGVVKLMNPSQGTRVGRGALLVQVYDPGSLRLRAAVPNEHSDAATSGNITGELDLDTGRVPVRMVSVAPESKPGRGSVDALFTLPGDDWLLGTAVRFDLVLPTEARTVAVPFDALYAGSRIYVVGADDRAEAIECANIGQTVADDATQALLRCPELSPGAAIVVNRIPNLVTGTKLRAVQPQA